MAISKIEVIHAVKVPAGQFVDGATETEQVWLMGGVHDVDADFLTESQWLERGLVSLI